MQHMQERLTAEFERVASEAGLDLVQVTANRNGGDGVATSWLVMDGLDARLSIQALFASGRVNVTLGGQATSDQPNSWYREHGLFPKAAPQAGMKVTDLGALYTDGERLRRIFGTVRALLAPYVKQGQPPAPFRDVREWLTAAGVDQGTISVILGEVRSGQTARIPHAGGSKVALLTYDREQDTYALTEASGDRALLADTPVLPGESLASRKAAGEVLTGYGLTEHEAGLVLRRAYGHLSASFNYTGVPGARLGYVDYDREQGTYAVRTPEDTPAEGAR